MELWSSLLNHHLHRGHEPAFADPAGCSSYGARHATCYGAMELWSILFNHHLHWGHEPAVADPAGCSSYGARHATCTDKAPRERSTQTTPSRNLTLGGKEQKERKPQKTRSPRDPEGTPGKTDQRGNQRRRCCHEVRGPAKLKETDGGRKPP